MMKWHVILIAAILVFAIAYVVLRNGRNDALIRPSKTAQSDNTVQSLVHVGQSSQPASISTSSRSPSVSCPSRHAANSNTVVHYANETGTVVRGDMKNQQQESSGVSSRVVAASSEFKNRPGDRQKSARTIFPLLKPGLSRSDVKDLLGPPTKVIGDGRVWCYILFYESAMDVYFDADGKLERVLGLD